MPSDRDHLQIDHPQIDIKTEVHWLVCWLVVLRINVDLAIFQPYLDLEAGDNLSLKIQVAREVHWLSDFLFVANIMGGRSTTFTNINRDFY